MIWALVGLLAGLLLAEVLIQIRAVRVVLALIENSPPFRIESLPPDPDAERLEMRTQDGLTLRGSLYRQTERAPRGLIVFCHEYGNNHWSSMLYASALWKAGFSVMSFDFRNLGESDCQAGYEPLHWLTQYEVTDLNAVIDYIQQQPDLKDLPLGLFGISRGGSAALYAASVRPEVKAVACEGAFGTWLMLLAHARRWISLIVPERLAELIPWWHVKFTLWLALSVSQFRRNCRYSALERVLPQLNKKPLLVIAGERDTYVLPEVPIEICRLAGQPEALWLVANAKHNLGRLVDSEEYDQQLVEFFGVLDGRIEKVAARTTRIPVTNSTTRQTAETPSPVARRTPLQFSIAKLVRGWGISGG